MSSKRASECVKTVPNRQFYRLLVFGRLTVPRFSVDLDTSRCRADRPTDRDALARSFERLGRWPSTLRSVLSGHIHGFTIRIQVTRITFMKAFILAAFSDKLFLAGSLDTGFADIDENIKRKCYRLKRYAEQYYL